MDKRDHVKAVIGGTLSHSLNDVIGEVSYVIWFCGCNFRCPFCQNYPMVIADPSYCSLRDLDEILQEIIDIKPYIQFVQTTGGEPTLQHQALDYLYKKVKSLGLNTSLDTNGSQPHIIDALIKKNLLDHLAMDVKAPLVPKKYSRVIGLPQKLAENHVKAIRSSLMLAKNLSFVEIRTTYVPKLLTREDILEIAEFLTEYLTKSKHYYVLQQFIPNSNAPEPAFRSMKVTPINKLKEIAKEVKNYLPNVAIRHINGVDYL